MLRLAHPEHLFDTTTNLNNWQWPKNIKIICQWVLIIHTIQKWIEIMNIKINWRCTDNGSHIKKNNKTGLQPVSRPVEQILGFYPKGFKCENVFNKCSAPKLYKVQHLRHCQTCYQTSGNRIGQIWPDL